MERERMPGWMTTSEVARLFGVTMRRVLALMSSRGIAGRRVGQSWLWPAREVRKVFEGRRAR